MPVHKAWSEYEAGRPETPEPYKLGPPEVEQRTRQSDAQSADINLTIKKYNLQPDQMVPGWSGRGQYGDLTSIPSYQEALNSLAKGREAFYQLPADVRLFFGNDPAVLLDAWNQGEHAEVFKRIGWLEELPVESPPAGTAAVPPVTPAP